VHNDCGGSRTAFRLAEPAVLDCCVRKDFDAADHHPGQHGDRFAAIDRGGKGRRVIQTEIDLAAPNRLRQPARRCLDIADIGETLGTQQLLGEVLGGYTDVSDLGEADGRCFEGPLGGERWRRAEQAYGAGQ
jgi:hypothetical protein